MLTVRDRKDPREKKGNDQRIPLLAVPGYDAMALIEEQRAVRGKRASRCPRTRVYSLMHRGPECAGMGGANALGSRGASSNRIGLRAPSKSTPRSDGIGDSAPRAWS